MFLIIAEESAELVSFIQAVSKITDEMRLRISPEKVWFRGMDSAHVSMIDFELPKSYFVEYSVEKEEIINVVVEKLIKFLKGVKKDEKLGITFDRERGKLIVKAIGNYVREFATPLLDVGETTSLGLPKVDFPVTFKITCSVLQDALKDIRQITDKVRFYATEEELQIKGESDEGYETAISLKYESRDVIDREIRDKERLPASATYNVEIINGVVKEISRVSELVSLSFGTDLPLKLKFDFSNNIKFDFYLAPRIE